MVIFLSRKNQFENTNKKINRVNFVRKHDFSKKYLHFAFFKLKRVTSKVTGIFKYVTVDKLKTKTIKRVTTFLHVFLYSIRL